MTKPLMLKILILVLFAIFFTTACKKNSDEITVNFKCKLNGSTWIPYNNDLKLREAEAHLTNDGAELFIKAINTRLHQEIGFRVYTPGKAIVLGKYDLYMPNGNSAYLSKNDFKGEYKTKGGYEGTVEILRLDKKLKQITGRFSFKLYNETTGDSANVTSGEFNLQYFNF